MHFTRNIRNIFFGLTLAFVTLAGISLCAQTKPATSNASNATTLTPITLAPTPGTPANGAQPAPADKGPDIHDLHDPVLLTFWEQYGFEIIVGSIIAIIVLGLLIAFFMRKKPAPTLTAYQRAIVELARARELQNTGQDKAFAIAASDAVRRYLEDAYRMPAPERTTEEFLVEAAHHAWMQGELTILLKRFLEFCDLAKFAGQQFGEEEGDKLLAAAREFLAAAEKLRQPATTPAPQPAPVSRPPAKPTPTTP